MGTTCAGYPLISVVMPVYNCESYIESAIRSVMGQSFSHWELIVLDDGSTDSTCRIVRRLEKEDARIQLHCNSANMGVAKTRNRGIDLSRGEYIAFLDSDDLWHPDKLLIQLNRMQAEAADICYTSYAIIGANGEQVKEDYIVPLQITFQELLKENVIGCSTVLLSRHVLTDHRFITDFYHEDYVLWLDLLQNGHKAVGCVEPLTKWRFIADSRSFDKRRSARNRWNIYRKHLHLPLVKSICVFAAYVIRGIRKYF